MCEIECFYVLMWYFNEMLEFLWIFLNLNIGKWKEGDLVLELRVK